MRGRAQSIGPDEAEFSEAWIEGDATARWESAPTHGSGSGAGSSGSSMLRVGVGCRLPRHTDSAEETIVVLSGAAVVVTADGERRLSAEAIAVIPAALPHEVRNAGESELRFAAIYADADVITTYEADVQPDGEPTRRAVP